MRLKEARETLGLSQKELGQLAGTGQSEISKLELGQRQLTVRWALRLAPFLRVTAEQLLLAEVVQETTENTKKMKDYQFDMLT